MAVHRRLCYPHGTSAAVVYGGRGYWTNGQRICLTRSTKTLRLCTGNLRLARKVAPKGERENELLFIIAAQSILAPYALIWPALLAESARERLEYRASTVLEDCTVTLSDPLPIFCLHPDGAQRGDSRDCSYSSLGSYHSVGQGIPREDDDHTQPSSTG